MVVGRFPGYKPSPLPDIDAETSLIASHPQITDVEAQFARICAHGDFLEAWDGELIPDLRYTRVNIGKKGRARNHFQGIQRLRLGKYMVVSGGDITEPASHLFLFNLKSRRARGPWGSNVLLAREPIREDSIVKTIALDEKLWHAGGISVLGDILAVPIEGGERSRIAFLHMADPLKPKRLPCDIDRPDRKASAVALARMPGGKFVCGVWWEAARKFRGRIDFYVSRSRNFLDGFHDRVVTYSFNSLGLGDDRDPSYQNINFILQRGEDSEAALYMIGTENGADAAPVFGGPDIADLYRIELPEGFLNGDDSVDAPKLTRVAARQFRCKNQYGNLDAAGGIYVDSNGRLNLYAGYHWRVDHMIRLTEFSSEPDRNAPKIEKIADARIDLFEHERFRGRRLSVIGKTGARLPDYGKLFVEGSGFDDRVSSVRYQIPRGHKYRLYKDKAFAGRKSGTDYIDLVGSGAVEEIANLKHKPHSFGDKISSSQYI